MKKILFIVPLLFMFSCSGKSPDEVLGNKYRYAVLPESLHTAAQFIEAENRKEILVLLHNGFEKEEITDHFGIGDSVYDLQINELFGRGLIKMKEDGKFMPSCLMIDTAEGGKMKRLGTELGEKFALIVIDRLPKIKEAYSKIAGLKNLPFEDHLYLLLAGVMLGNPQIKFLEESFIKSAPTSRGPHRYYLALMEQTKDGANYPFGLQFEWCVDSDIFSFRSYGATLPASKPAPSIGLLNEIIKLQALPNYTLPLKLKEQAEKSGIILGGKIETPVINPLTRKELNALAGIITKDLVNYLEKQRPLLVKHFLNSPFKDEASFREWFVWVYKFIAASATDYLKSKNYIKPAGKSTASYFVIG